MLGKLIDRRYQINKILGAGGFGQTYLAEDTKLPGNPVCVVKQLKPTSDDPKTLQVARRLFASEAQVLQQLGNHDQIPRLLAYFEENQEFFLVQEFVDGESVSKELLPNRRWSEAEVIDLLQGILEPLTFVHQSQIIHRDIKPANLIRRREDDKIVLIDFGAVKEVAVTQVNSEGQSTPTVVIGTTGYMPSEQTKGSPKLSSDIYAVGIIGIQALTGLTPEQLRDDPYTGEIAWHAYAQTTPVLANIIDKMVRYDFRQRYQSAIEALQALRQQPLFSPDIPQTILPAYSTPLHELTLEWFEAKEHRTQTIIENHPTKNLGTFRIGRDPGLCDLLLSEPTVSRLHVEIFFNPHQQCFYLRSLNQNNPPVVDGQLLLTGEIALHEGSNVRLGQMEFTVTAITLNQPSTGYVPNQPSSPPPAIPQQPLPPTLRPPSSHSQQPPQSYPPSVPSQYRQEVPNQSQTPQPHPSPVQTASPQLGGGFWLKWVLMNVVGLVIGIPVTHAIFSIFLNQLIAYVAFGFVTGIFQWLALRGVVKRPSLWGLVTGLVSTTFFGWFVVVPVTGGVLFWQLRRS